MANLFAAATDAVLADPAITLMNFIKEALTDLTVPLGFPIRVDTKFDNMSLSNQIIIKKMVSLQPPECLGVSRYRYTATYKIHVWCQGKSAKNNKHIIESEIERIIKTAPLGMFTDGIETAMLDDFTEIETGKPETHLNKGFATDDVDIARSAATCRLFFSKYVV